MRSIGMRTAVLDMRGGRVYIPVVYSYTDEALSSSQTPSVK